MNVSTCLLFSDDLSFHADATQYLTHPGPYFGANNAVDRNTSTCMRTYDIGPKSQKKTTWWKVDLGAVHNIYSINILFKNYENYGMYHIDNTEFRY